MKLLSLLLLSVLLFVSGVTYAQLTPDRVVTPPVDLNGLPAWLTNPDQVMGLIQKWGVVFSAIGVLLGGLIGWAINEVKVVKGSLSDLHAKVDAANAASDSSANSQSSATTKQLSIEVSDRPSDPGKVWLMIPFLAAILFVSGCAKDANGKLTGGLTPAGQQDVKLGLAILNTAIDTYTQIDASKTNGKPLSKGQIAQLAKNDVNGVLAQMQGNVGKTPDDANNGDGVAVGAANPKVGQAIQDALPPFTITQSTINQIAAVAK